MACRRSSPEPTDRFTPVHGAIAAAALVEPEHGLGGPTSRRTHSAIWPGRGPLPTARAEIESEERIVTYDRCRSSGRHVQ